MNRSGAGDGTPPAIAEHHGDTDPPDDRTRPAPLTVLVVEDSPSTREMLSLTLATAGYAVVEASDGWAALAAAGRALPDLVVQDLVLPDMQGLELLRLLRGLPGGQELPILALSGFLRGLEDVQTHADGFTGILVKPVEPSRLVDTVRAHLPPRLTLAATDGDGLRLLVVEDDPVQLKLLRVHFAHLGFEVSAATGASAAFAAARANRPDAILCDVFMSGRDGFDFCLDVRRDASLGAVPVVLLSPQHGPPPDQDLARRVGANALVPRTPGFAAAARALLDALTRPRPAPAGQSSDALALSHARKVIRQLERQAVATAGLIQRCGIQAGQLSLLNGVADALTRDGDPDLALRDVLAATLDAAGIAKGALLLRDARGRLTVSQAIGFSAAERAALEDFFGHRTVLAGLVDRGVSVAVPSPALPVDVSRDILAGANVAAAQIVPLTSEGRGMGAMIIGATGTDVTSDDSVAFARAMGNQIVQSLALARSVARLAVSEKRYRALLESANDFIAVLTPDGVVLELNQRWVELTGLTREQLVGRHVRDFAPAGTADETAASYRAAIRSGTTHTTPVEIARPHGPSAFIEFSSTNVEVGGEQLVFAIGRDVTAHLHAVAALAAAEERMRFALTNADVGIWDLDYTTGRLQWSEQSEAHFGLPVGTFGSTFEAFIERVHPGDRQALRAVFASAEERGTDFSAQYRSICPDGTHRWLRGVGRVLLDAGGRPVRAVGISLDVTKGRTLEEQYQQAQKMEAVGRLAGGVAHDFNNLLTVILGYCELLLADDEAADVRHGGLEEIQNAAIRAGGLTRQLLAFSRKQIIEPRVLDLNLIATEMRELIGRLIGEDVAVVLNLRPHLASITADRGQVEQVVMNLAVNARDAMPRGGTLTIETAHVELDEHYATAHFGAAPGPYVVLTMSDTGTGMTAEVQARLFEPFFTTKEPGKGTGLGMATVHGIVSQAGGSIGVYSELGHGTAFKVYFPRTTGAMETAAKVSPAARSPRNPHTVLVVEDDDSLRDLTQRLLLRLGYTVLIAEDAADARRLAAAHPAIDLLLTDVVMPGVSGPDLIRQLIAQRPALKVIFMSGYTEDAIAQHGVLKPGIAFLHKPFTSAALGQKIRDVLDTPA